MTRSFVLILLITGLLTSVGHSKVIHTEKSLYRNISVTQKKSLKCLVFETRKENPPYQTCVDLRDPKKLVFSYTRMILSGLVYKPDSKNILVLGLGGGTLPLTLSELLPEATITSVEIDPAVIKIAKEHFDYQENERLITEAKDARLFVKRAALKKQSFDWIILDAFNGDYIPEHLMTKEFFEEVKSILNEDGIITANTFSSSQLYAYESATYHAVFGDFFNVKQRNSGNRIVLATNDKPLKSFDEIREQAKQLSSQLKPYGVDTRWLIRLFNKEKDWSPEATILTDQFSPANLLKQQ